MGVSEGTVGKVSFTLERHGAETATTLIVCHEDLPDPLGYAAGWHIHLDYLGAYLAGEDKPFADFWEPYDTLVQAYAAGPG